MALSEGQSNISQDINELFDSIVLSEQQSSEKGFNHGFEKGLLEGEVEGFHLGYHRGSELGAELGFYRGVAEVCISSHENLTNDSSLKVTSAFLKVVELLDQVPNTNSDINIIALRDNIRAKYKRACSLMKISGIYPETSKFTF